MRKITLASLALIISISYAQAEWIELETKDPFGEDFKYTLYADETHPDIDFGYAPESILIYCEKRSFFLYVLSADFKGSARVRYKFDDDPVVDEYWKATFYGGAVFPESMNGEFFENLMTKSKLTIELIGGLTDDGGHAIFSGLLRGQEDVRQRFEKCEQ